MTDHFKNIFLSIAIMSVFSTIGFGQSNEFTYQGRLLDNNLPMTANYDFEFSLWNSLANGTQQGSTQTISGVAVANGIFTVRLNFGAQFDGTARFLQITVRPAGPGSYTTLAPRQPITSGPYAIRSLNSTTADTATNALNLDGVAASQYVVTTDPRMADARNPLPNSANYIWNQNSVLQPSSNFVISGNGDVGGTLAANIIRATTQYNIGATRILSNGGTDNIFAGVGAGNANTTGSQNSFVGRDAGLSNIDGTDNSFFGRGAGALNTTGSNNSYFGRDAGLFINGFNNSFFGRSAGRSSTGSENSFFGRDAGLASSGQRNSFFGRSAGAANSASDNSFFGALAGSANNSGTSNSFFGANAGESNTSGTENSFFGRSAGRQNMTGNNNSFFGSSAGRANTGNDNSFFGRLAGDTNTTGSDNSFFGSEAGINNDSGVGNSYFGSGAGFGSAVAAGSFNSFFGRDAGRANSGNDNSFFGESAGDSNTGGDSNSFFGRFAGTTNTNGDDNSFFGRSAGNNNGGSSNSFFGRSAGLSNGSGSFNSFFGQFAGINNIAGNFNTVIGYGADVIFDGLSNATAIGMRAAVGASNSLVLGSINGTNGAVSDTNVGIGTTTPGTRLHVVGGSDAQLGSGGYIVTGSTTGLNLAIDNNEIMSRNNGAVSALLLNADGGNVGIGTSNPVDTLHVDGIIRVNALGAGGETVVCRNAFNQLSTCSFFNALQVEVTTQKSLISEQQRRIETLNLKINDQQTQIDALRKLVCAQNPTAELCRSAAEVKP